MEQGGNVKNNLMLLRYREKKNGKYWIDLPVLNSSKRLQIHNLLKGKTYQIQVVITRYSETGELFYNTNHNIESILKIGMPLITSSPINQTVQQGRNVKFTCEGDGTPTWMRNGYKAEIWSSRFNISRKILSIKENQEISPIRSEIGMRQEVSLIISKVLKKDTGEYLCISRSRQASTYLTVTCN